MQLEQVKSLQKWSFWVAALLHLLVFIFFSYVWVHQVIKQDKADNYIPAYAYHESAQTMQQKNVKNTPVEEVIKKNIPTSKNGIEKPVFDQKEIRFNQIVDISSKKSSEPVHLIGDNSKTPQPLIIILGKALTAKLLYPKAAIDLTIGGISVIGFVLYPDGQVTDVHLLKSSGAEVLDQAALTAASQISPVKNVASYVQEPMPIVFGIIFGSSR